MKEEKKRVALYIRVSSDEQKREGLSIEAQKRKLEQYCEFKDWYVFKIYQDEGKSGKSVKGRPAFSQMLKDTDKFSAILITKFDRAFRNVKEGLITLDYLHENNIDFISITEVIDTTSSMGKAMFTIIATFAELERQLTRDRNKAIMRDKFDMGIPIGKIPFGYKALYKNKKEKKGIIKIEIDKKKSEIVRAIFDKTAKGIGYKEICYEYGLKPQSYYNMIRNRVYLGLVAFDGEEKTGTQGEIISKELFNKVNKNG